MFKRGGRINTKPAGGAAAAAGGGAGGAGSGSSTRRGGKGGETSLDSLTAKLERKVANCLSCGKIFDCRSVTNDIIRFIGGLLVP